jgi:hypothetical protein
MKIIKSPWHCWVNPMKIDIGLSHDSFLLVHRMLSWTFLPWSRIVLATGSFRAPKLHFCGAGIARKCVNDRWSWWTKQPTKRVANMISQLRWIKWCTCVWTCLNSCSAECTINVIQLRLGSHECPNSTLTTCPANCASQKGAKIWKRLQPGWLDVLNYGNSW